MSAMPAPAAEEVPDVAEIMAQLTAKGVPCPACGTPLVAARLAIVGAHPTGDIGFACRQCECAFVIGD